VYEPAAQREIIRMDRSDAERIIHALEVFVTTGHGDVEALNKSCIRGTP
jgi:tRNA A37 N6-isopentenylltransferase MiaA